VLPHMIINFSKWLKALFHKGSGHFF